MSLHFPIKINQGTIGYVAIHRLNKLVTEQPSRYEYEITLQRRGGTILDKDVMVGEVEHNYDDGALVLIAKVMEAAAAERGKVTGM